MRNPLDERRTVKKDIYQTVTDSIISSLEQGVKPWAKPWSSANTSGRIILPRRSNGEAYRGINILMLWGASLDRGYRSPTWLTYQQATEQGGQVRKGETGSKVVYAGSITRTEEGAAPGEDSEQRIPFLKSYTVFNTEQIDGLGDRYPIPDTEPLPTFERIERADQFTAATGATIRHGGNRAYYSPGPDVVQMPAPEAFRDPPSYYATLIHELTHWTGHTTRLAREYGKRFADKAYAFEELIAELGAAFLSAALDLTPEPREDHAAYLAHWLDVLKADKRAIFTAASQAQRAADFLFQREAA